MTNVISDILLGLAGTNSCGNEDKVAYVYIFITKRECRQIGGGLNLAYKYHDEDILACHLDLCILRNHVL